MNDDKQCRGRCVCVAVVARSHATETTLQDAGGGDVSRRSSRRHMVAVYNYDAPPTTNDRHGEVLSAGRDDAFGSFERGLT